MARIHTVQKANKPHKCGKCGAEIAKGDPYRHVTIKTGQRSSRRMERCMSAKCSFRPSELTTARRGEVYAAVEELEDFMAEWDPEEESGDLDDVKGALADAAGAINDVAAGYREAAENIEQGFGHETEQSAELASTADDLESWASDLESLDLPEWDEEDEDWHDWTAEVKGAVENALGDCPV